MSLVMPRGGVRYLRATYDIPRRRRDPAQPKICSFFPHKDGRARCRGCRVDTSARDAVAGTPELSRQVAAFLVGDIASIRA